MVGETIMLIAYGLPVKPIDDPYLKTAERALQQLSLAAVPGKYLVDSLLIEVPAGMDAWSRFSKNGSRGEGIGKRNDWGAL